MLAEPVLYICLQIMAIRIMSGLPGKLAIGVGFMMAALFLFVVWAIAFGQGSMAPMLLITASPLAFIALALHWGFHGLAKKRAPDDC